METTKKKSVETAKTRSMPGVGISWGEETEHLRAVLLGCGLTEETKWGKPCFTLGGKNVAVIIPLKDHCALMFFKGALLADAKGLLTRIGEHTQAGRWIKFDNARDIVRMKPALKAYVREAMEVEKAGLKVKLKKTSDFSVPEELEKKFREMPALKKAFNALTPGRQRNYLYHFSGAKQAATREARIGKYVQQILDGKGLLD